MGHELLVRFRTIMVMRQSPSSVSDIEPQDLLIAWAKTAVGPRGFKSHPERFERTQGAESPTPGAPIEPIGDPELRFESELF